MTTAWYIDIKVTPPNRPLIRVRDHSPVNTKAGAKEHERQVRQSILDGTWGKEVKEVPTVEKFSTRFLDHAKTNNKKSTARSKGHILDKHINPYFGTMKLDQVSTGRIEAFKAQLLGKKLGKKSVNNVLTVLGKLLHLAHDWGELENVPKIQWLKAAKPSFDFLTHEEANRLVMHAEEGRWKTMIIAALNTGLRIGEICGLQWQDLDLKAGRLMVRRRAYRGELDSPKSGRAREVPLNDRAIKAFKDWQATELRLPWVFPQKDGGFIRNPQHACDVAIHRCAEAAALQTETRSIGWHTLRHTFASHLAMAGVSLKAIQELLGHATITMTERYAHLTPNVKREAVQMLEDANQAATKSQGHPGVTKCNEGSPETTKPTDFSVGL